MNITTMDIDLAKNNLFILLIRFEFWVFFYGKKSVLHERIGPKSSNRNFADLSPVLWQSRTHF